MQAPPADDGSTHWQPLGDRPFELITTLPRKDDNPFNFPGKNPGQPIVNFENRWKWVNEAGGCRTSLSTTSAGSWCPGWRRAALNSP